MPHIPIALLNPRPARACELAHIPFASKGGKRLPNKFNFGNQPQDPQNLKSRATNPRRRGELIRSPDFRYWVESGSRVSGPGRPLLTHNGSRESQVGRRGRLLTVYLGGGSAIAGMNEVCISVA
jgi:hypothetical protein